MMKRKICMVLVVLMMFAFNVTAFADASDTTDKTVNLDNFTIIFDENTTLTADEMLAIAQRRVKAGSFDGSQIEQKNVLCSLFGHKTTTNSVIVIQHKYSATRPRCLKTYEDITSCTRCDTVTNIEVEGSIYIDCCE